MSYVNLALFEFELGFSELENFQGTPMQSNAEWRRQQYDSQQSHTHIQLQNLCSWPTGILDTSTAKSLISPFNRV